MSNSESAPLLGSDDDVLTKEDIDSIYPNYVNALSNPVAYRRAEFIIVAVRKALVRNALRSVAAPPPPSPNPAAQPTHSLNPAAQSTPSLNPAAQPNPSSNPASQPNPSSNPAAQPNPSPNPAAQPNPAAADPLAALDIPPEVLAHVFANHPHIGVFLILIQHYSGYLFSFMMFLILVFIALKAVTAIFRLPPLSLPTPLPLFHPPPPPPLPRI